MNSRFEVGLYVAQLWCEGCGPLRFEKIAYHSLGIHGEQYCKPVAYLRVSLSLLEEKKWRRCNRIGLRSPMVQWLIGMPAGKIAGVESGEIIRGGAVRM